MPDGTEEINYPSLLSVALFAILSQEALKAPGIKVSLHREGEPALSCLALEYTSLCANRTDDLTAVCGKGEFCYLIIYSSYKTCSTVDHKTVLKGILHSPDGHLYISDSHWVMLNSGIKLCFSWMPAVNQESKNGEISLWIEFIGDCVISATCLCLSLFMLFSLLNSKVFFLAKMHVSGKQCCV